MGGSPSSAAASLAPSSSRRKIQPSSGQRGVSTAAQESPNKKKELEDFLKRSAVSGLAFSDSESDTSDDEDGNVAPPEADEKPRRSGGGLVMLRSSVDPRGHTIRRVVTDVFDEEERLLLVKRRASAAKMLAKSTLSEQSRDSATEPVSQDDFEYLKVIGVGGMGRVLLVRCRRDAQLYAMKVVSKASLRDARMITAVLSERDVLAGTNHPGLARLHWAFQSANALFLVMDYCPGGELSVHLRRASRFPEELVYFYGAELLLAIEHLHRHGIIYRDLKPENVLLTEDGHLKLVDFGISKFGMTDSITGARTICGSYEYIAPEVVQEKEYGTAVDWWAYGAVLYELLTGLPPWYNHDRQVMFKCVLTQPLVLPSYLSSDAKDLLSSLLMKDPQRRLGTRLGSSEIRSHAFFRPVDWDLVTFREVHPPIQPCRSSDTVEDATNFSSDFTRLVVGRVDGDGSLGPNDDDEDFAGFDFEAPAISHVEYDYSRDLRGIARGSAGEGA